MKNRKIILMTLFLLFVSFFQCFGDEDIKETNKDGVIKLIADLKKTVVFIGKMKGNINQLELLTLKELSEEKSRGLYSDLLKKGYIDQEGNITNNFKPFQNNFKFGLNDEYSQFETGLFEIFKKNLTPAFVATGFLVNIEGIHHLVTAKHVIVNNLEKENLKDTDLFIFYNPKDISGDMQTRSVESLKKYQNLDLKWIFHPEPKVDIAVIPFPFDEKKDDILVIDESDFLYAQELSELLEVLFLSYQPGVVNEKRISPIIRKGMISLIDEDKTFVVDGFVFPGNSGSPTFLKFAPIAFSKEKDPYFINIKQNLGIRLLGVVSGSIPSQEIAVSVQTGRPRMVFEDNTGLTKIWSSNYIKEIIDSEKFKSQLDRIKKYIEENKQKAEKEKESKMQLKKLEGSVK